MAASRLPEPDPAPARKLAERPVDSDPSPLKEDRPNSEAPLPTVPERPAAPSGVQLRYQLLNSATVAEREPGAGQLTDDMLEQRLGIKQAEPVGAEPVLPVLLASASRVVSATQIIGSDGRPVICTETEDGESSCRALPATDPNDPFDPRAVLSVSPR